MITLEVTDGDLHISRMSVTLIVVCPAYFALISQERGTPGGKGLQDLQDLEDLFRLALPDESHLRRRLPSIVAQMNDLRAKVLTFLRKSD